MWKRKKNLEQLPATGISYVGKNVIDMTKLWCILCRRKNVIFILKHDLICWKWIKNHNTGGRAILSRISKEERKNWWTYRKWGATRISSHYCELPCASEPRRLCCSYQWPSSHLRVISYCVLLLTRQEL